MEAETFLIEVSNRGERFACRQGDLLLIAMERAGKRAISVGCRKGGCGMCKVRVLTGTYETLPMSRAQVSEAEQHAGFALACRLRPTSALQIESDHFQNRSDPTT